MPLAKRALAIKNYLPLDIMTAGIRSEREPLIRTSSCSTESTITSVRTLANPQTYGLDRETSIRRPSTSDSPGPLEISSRTRHGILAGIWLAQFLSVRTHLLIV